MKCVMCKKEKKICDSHIIPKLFGKYIKSNSLSGGLRSPDDVNKRKQDLSKIPLLCEECEEIFSKLETEFKKEVFDQIAVKLNENEKKLRKNEKWDELLEVYSKNKLKNLKIKKEIYDFVISIFYRIGISKGISLEQWHDDEKNILNEFLQKAEKYFLNSNKNSEIKFEGKFYLINNNIVLEKLISEKKEDYIEEAGPILYTNVTYPLVHLFPSGSFQEKYMMIAVVVPYFIMVYELYPNKNFEEASSEELKIGNTIYKEDSKISEWLIKIIFNESIKDLNKGRNNLTKKQREKIINLSKKN